MTAHVSSLEALRLHALDALGDARRAAENHDPGKASVALRLVSRALAKIERRFGVPATEFAIEPLGAVAHALRSKGTGS